MPWLANAMYYMVILAVKRSGFWFLKLASAHSDESKHTLKLEKKRKKRATKLNNEDIRVVAEQ